MSPHQTPSFQVLRRGTPEGDFRVEDVTPVFVVCAGNAIFVAEHAATDGLRAEAQQAVERYRSIVQAFAGQTREGAYLTAANLIAVRYAEGLRAAHDLLNQGIAAAAHARDAAVKGMFLSKIIYRLLMVVLKSLVAGGAAWLIIHTVVPEQLIERLPKGVDRDIASKLTGICIGLLSFMLFNWLSRRRVDHINSVYDTSCRTAVDEYSRRLSGEFEICSRAAQTAWESLAGRIYLEGDALRAVVRGTLVKDLLAKKHSG